jgi:hypothetical protein
VTQDDVRRVIANWAEYGGLVPEKRAKDRPAYEDEVDPALLIEARAVFPLELLRRVAEVRRERTHEPNDSGVNQKARDYALSKLVYCAHCEKQAQEQDDPRLRGRLTGGPDARKKRRYKHKPGVVCGVTNRTVPADIIEAEFGRLLKLLTIREDALDPMTEMAIQSQQGSLTEQDEEELEKQKKEAIAVCQRRIDAAVHLYGDGRITREEYLRRVEINEREIAHWQARTTETQQKALELSMCIEAVNRIAQIWDTADDEDRKGLAQYLFSEIVFDLDTRRIVSYKLKPWADEFITLRMELYYQEFGDVTEGTEGYEKALEKEDCNELLGCCNPMPHRGIQGRSFPQVLFAVSFAMAISYRGLELPRSPVSNGTIPKCVRNAEIRARHQKGESIATLAEFFGITEQRIWQILNDRRK